MSDEVKFPESIKIRWELVPYTRGRGLDLGCGDSKPFQHFIGVDNNVSKISKPNVLADAEDLSLFGSQSMAFIFSSYLLNQFEDTAKVLKEWWRLIKPNGYLVLYLPHKDLAPKDKANKHDFLPEDIITIMEEVGNWDLVENQLRTEDPESSFFQVYQKKLKAKTHSWKKPKPEKTCAVIRYGAFGDALQTASIFPELKKQGYHVTFYTAPMGYEVTKEDPNVDRFIIQDTDQVPNAELGPYWKYWKKRYDKFINLSESVEGEWLALPGRTKHEWPYSLRKKYMNVNYLEFMHDLAEVPFTIHQKFYSTTEEKNWAKQQRDRMGEFVVVWSLAGSSVHKTWPYLDKIIARLMLHNPGIEVVLVGDYLCQLLEQGWENEVRVHRKSGKWTIRQSLAFLEQADMVIGPETGVLNAAAYLDVPKIITMSHSSVENLTRDWKNCESLIPKTSCWPCHRLHYSFEHCWKNEETGTAQCQADISADKMWEVLLNYLPDENSIYRSGTK